MKVACLFIFRYLRFGIRHGNSYQLPGNHFDCCHADIFWAMSTEQWALNVELSMPFNFKYLQKIVSFIQRIFFGWMGILVRSTENIVLFSFHLSFRKRNFCFFSGIVHNIEWHLNYKCDNCLKMTSQYNKFEWKSYTTQPNQAVSFRCGAASKCKKLMRMATFFPVSAFFFPLFDCLRWHRIFRYIVWHRFCWTGLKLEERLLSLSNEICMFYFILYAIVYFCDQIKYLFENFDYPASVQFIAIVFLSYTLYIINTINQPTKLNQAFIRSRSFVQFVIVVYFACNNNWCTSIPAQSLAPLFNVFLANWT